VDWEDSATVIRQDDTGVNQSDWDTTPTTPQDNIIINDFKCSVRTSSNNQGDDAKGFSVSGDAIIVGEYTTDIKREDEIKFSSDRKFKVLVKPITFRGNIRLEVKRM